LAGVSIATVSRALNGHPDVEEGKRARIHALAAELHYHPNRMAQHLYGGTRRTIGILIFDIVDNFFSQVVSSLCRQAACHEFQVMICETHGDLSSTLQAFTTLIEQRVTAIITCCPSAEIIPAEILLAARSHDIALINLDNTKSAIPVDAIHSDEGAMAQLATRYLYQLGHRRIGYFGVAECYDHMRRAHSVQTALRHLGLPMTYFAYGGFAESAHLIDAWKAHSPACRPTAVIAWNDYQALYLLREADRRGLRIPEDFSLLGYGDLHFAAYLNPALTTISQCAHQYGEYTFSLLLKRLHTGFEPAEAPIDLVMPATLVQRESCAPPDPCSLQ